MDEYLTVTVLQEKRPVTYKLLARQLGLHVNKAKQGLWEFVQGNQQVHSVYYLSGDLLSEDRHAMRLVKDSELEETKKLFKNITGMHVYSVLPYDPKDLSVLVAASKDIPHLALADRIKCGVLKSSTGQDSHQPRKAAPVTATKQQQPAAIAPSKPAAAATASSNTPKPTQKPASIFGSSVAAKKTPSNTLGKREREHQQPAAKSSSGSAASTPKKKVSPQKPSISADDIFSDEPKEPQQPSISADDIFSDDDESMSDAAAAAAPAAVATPVRDDPMQTDDNADTAREAPAAATEAEDEEEAAVPAAPGKIRRKVLRKKTYTNERGFMVTEDVWEWEEADAGSPAEAASPRSSKQQGGKSEAAGKKAGAGKKKAGSGQKDLFSFWKR